jgi:hypothetical protein
MPVTTAEPYLASIDDIRRASAYSTDTLTPRTPQRRVVCADPLVLPPHIRAAPRPPPTVSLANRQPATLGHAAATSDPAFLAPEDFLASKADLFSILAHVSGGCGPHSQQRRHGQIPLQTAPSYPLPNVPAALTRPQSHSMMPASAQPSVRRNPDGAEDGPYRIQRRQLCKCGECRWCLDNLRWDRIFNERFADPTYYGRITIRHNSALSEAR